MKAVPDEPTTWSRLHPALRESWSRSSQYLDDPAGALAPIELDGSDLADYRRDHPLGLVLPVFDKLLIQPAAEAGLIVAIGDAWGRLLWVDGDRSTLRSAESGAFQPGANWSESAIGTSAPGVALATGRGAQVHQEEHFAYSAHRFSCSAAPIHDPHTGALLGVVDLTGGHRAVATHSLPLINAAISAAEMELKVHPPLLTTTRLLALGALVPQIYTAGVREPLSLRHAEILVLLTWHSWRRGSLDAGLSSAELAEMLYGEPGHEVSLRAEIVRLRRHLQASPAGGRVTLKSRPYRLSTPLSLDLIEAVQAMTRGDRSGALDLYGGALLPESEAPGIAKIRHEVSAALRESMVSDGSAAELWRYLQLQEAEGDDDAVWTALRILPAQSPLRAALVSRLQP